MLPIDPTHPLLSCNRVFLYPVGVASTLGWVQLNPLWHFVTNNGLDADTSWGWNQGAHPSILTGGSSPGAGTAAAFYSYWDHVWPDLEHKDFTVVARARYEGVDPGSGAGSFICGARDAGNGGWLFGIWDAGGTDEGVSLFLYDQSGNTWVATDQDSISTLIGTPHVLAAVYNSGDREITFYRSGMVTRRVTNAAHDWTPFVSSSNQQFCVGRADVGFIWPGDIGWVMVFARALGAADIMALTRDSEWPFVADDPLFILEDAEGSYTTSVSVASSLSPSTAGAVTFTTTIDAEAFVEGDFTVEPEPPATGTYTTIIGVGSSAYYDSPEFGVFITVVGVNSQITATAPVTFVTSVGITSQARGLLDGRRNLIDTARYRR